MRPVVPAYALLPVQALDVHALQTQPGGAQVLLDAHHVGCRCRGSSAPALTLHAPTKGLVLQVIEPGGPLDIGQRLAGRDLRPLEDLAAAQRPLELTHELLQVVLHHPVKRDHVAIDVVDDLHLGRLPQEVKGCTASKHLHVAGVLGKAGQDGVGQTAFAAQPGDDGRCHGEGLWVVVKLGPPPGRWQGLGWLTARSWIGGWSGC